MAEDLVLRREVVVKVLPPDLMAGLSLERFHAEMRHAARLQHPHIVPALSAGFIEYEAGPAAPYYLMPFVAGETLRARLDEHGALPAETVRRILLDVVDAVAYAHAQGVVHRDLKPDNVFLVGNNALVTDFGVSEAIHPLQDGSAIRGAGPTLGTPGYMAPEQADGSPGIDPRADLYSIGVLAYEALSGQRPFSGASIHELLLSQATEAPVPLGQLRPGVPPVLAMVVMRCLEKRPQDRFAGSAELHAALDRLAGGMSDDRDTAPVRRFAGRRRTVRLAGVALSAAALALAADALWRHTDAPGGNDSAHGASVALIAPQYFLGDTTANAAVAVLVDRVSTDLSRLEGLKVVNYMSVGALFRRGVTPTFSEIGQALGVEHLVVFTPIGDPRESRVAIQLVEAPTQAQVWVASYAPDSSNEEEVRTEVVSRVTHSLLGPSAALPIQAHSARARREAAHAAYLSGMLALRRRTPDGVEEAIRSFEQALRLDSTHTAARGRLATALGLQLSYGYRTTLGSYSTAARAVDLAERAIALDPTDGELVGFLGYVEYLASAPVSTVRADFDRAIKMRAAEADVAGWNALVLLREGKAAASLAESRRALELDPLSSVRHLTLSLAALGARRYELAGLEAKRAQDIEPELRRPRQVEALALLMQNRGAECAAMDLWPHLGVKAMCLRSAGRITEAQMLIDSLVRVAESEDDVSAVYSDVLPAQELATYYAWMGATKEALQYLRLAFARSPVGIDVRIVQSGIYDRVRQSPGFAVELQRLQDAVWPRVQEEQRRLQQGAGSSPVASIRRRRSLEPHIGS